MKIFKVEQNMKREVKRFGSSGVTMNPIFQTEKPVQMGRMDFQPKGVLGMHEATCDQLFIVVKGNGWVRTDIEDKFSISAGTAAFWVKGEIHVSGTETGMQAFVIEGDALNPEQFMKEIGKHELF